MKAFIEFGNRGGIHSGMIKMSQQEAAKMAATLVSIFTNSHDAPMIYQHHWSFKGVSTRRLTWQSPTHFVAVTLDDGVLEGAAASELWRMPTKDIQNPANQTA
jgi:hypothetical protein